MSIYHMTETEYRLAEVIWEMEPVRSGDLVKVCDKRYGWKKSTTYTFLKKLCEQGIFQNQEAVVTARYSKADYLHEKGEAFVREAYHGSLPRMIAAFMNHNKLTHSEIDEIEQLIASYKEDSR